MKECPSAFPEVIMLHKTTTTGDQYVGLLQIKI